MGKAKVAKELVEQVAKLGKDDAIKILDRISTPEQAVALKGPERAEYLQALDTVYGPQSKRAADMGFGKDTWYHGTTVPIEQFKDDAKGLSTGAQSAKRGFFFAQDPQTASDYAELAREKGVIREGDKVTTRYLSDTAELHNDAYDEVRSLNFDVDFAKGAVRRQQERNANTREVLQRRMSELESGKWPKGLSKQDIIETIERHKQQIESGEKFIANKTAEIEAATKKIQSIDDQLGSQGQNVLPVKLRAGEGKIATKDYKGAPYRDETYADIMAKAQERGNSGVLFKNTYDPGDPNHRVEQNIAAVFDPAQIRSKYAAFDPRFKDSPLLMSAVGKRPTAADVLSKLNRPFGKAVDLAGDALNAYDEHVTSPIGVMAADAATDLANLVRIPGTPAATHNKVLQDVGAAASLGGEIGLDPTNFVPGAGVVAKMSKGAKAAGRLEKVLSVLKGPKVSKAAHDAGSAVSIITGQAVKPQTATVLTGAQQNKPVLVNAIKKAEALVGPDEVQAWLQGKSTKEQILERIKDASKSNAPAPEAPTPLRPLKPEGAQ